MNKAMLSLLLADDDLDDCEFFEDALDEVASGTSLMTVNDGVQLMDFLLSRPDKYPDIIFLDLNMPRKSGVECIMEIKEMADLRHIPIVIFSTSLDLDVINRLYEMGAHYYIQKPGGFTILKRVIGTALALFTGVNQDQPERDGFVIQP
ncbi:hypothetical protein GCM10009119_37920 [Algoriphagus jejuensis]|uniref:Response regulatory domain-containing protein n=1 Tax=Algoriphagus jejuensis TaxID=419934 RepID=A0ABP3YJG6_9BACT